MTRVETILSEFTSIFTDNNEDKAVRRDMHKAINDIEKILKRDDFGNLLFSTSKYRILHKFSCCI